MSLSFEKTRGTRTIYFPLDSSSDYPPDFVVMIRPSCEHGFIGEDHFSAGVAFCNPSDHFVKRKGRAIAYQRMLCNGPPALIGTAQSIIDEITHKMIEINLRRDAETFFHIEDAYIPDMDEGQIATDLDKVLSFEALSEYFSQKEKNRAEQNSQVA